MARALSGWAAARLAGADRLRFAEAWAVPLLSFTPQVTAAAWASALLMSGAGPAAGTAVAAAALTAAVGPRAVPHRQPPAAGPVLRVLTANLLAGGAEAEAVVELVCRPARGRAARAGTHRRGRGQAPPGRAGRSAPALRDAAGAERRARKDHARYPLRGEQSAEPVSAARCTPGLTSRPGSPWKWPAYTRRRRGLPGPRGVTARWRGQLSALPAPGDGPRILAGDFNATLDHGSFAGPASGLRGCRQPGRPRAGPDLGTATRPAPGPARHRSRPYRPAQRGSNHIGAPGDRQRSPRALC